MPTESQSLNQSHWEILVKVVPLDRQKRIDVHSNPHAEWLIMHNHWLFSSWIIQRRIKWHTQIFRSSHHVLKARPAHWTLAVCPLRPDLFGMNLFSKSNCCCNDTSRSFESTEQTNHLYPPISYQNAILLTNPCQETVNQFFPEQNKWKDLSKTQRLFSPT